MGGGPRILIVGGGYGGMHTALHLERLLRPGEATVTIADPRSYMTRTGRWPCCSRARPSPSMSSSTRGRTSGTRSTSSRPRRLSWHPSQTGKRK